VIISNDEGPEFSAEKAKLGRRNKDRRMYEKFDVNLL
tara:strand:+ start:297 stop:407 length:111 start_codon:yes stop_codon:yes gene_type:complete